MTDVRVAFMPSGRRGSLPAGTTVLDAARRLGVDLDSVCGGRGICGRCQVSISEGEHAKHGITCDASSLSPASGVEARYAGERPLAAGRRLGCTARIEADVVLDVPSESQVHRQVVRKDADEREIAIDPVVRLHVVEVEVPVLGTDTSDLTRLREALAREWGLEGLEVDPGVVTSLQKTLRAPAAAGTSTGGDLSRAGWTVTVAVHDGREVTAIWPGYHDAAYGIAFDVGSTTVAGHLCNLHTGEVVASAGAMNPQIRFGEDLMSRVSYVMMNPGSEQELTRAVRGCLAKLTAELARAAGIDRNDVLEVVLVGNPVMHHLLLGLDPTELGGAPFALAVDEAVRRAAPELGLPVNDGARAYVLPCIAGHVGADTAGVVLSEAPHESDEVVLIVDVGTNAEIVLGNRERILAASSPTGPAFEGAQISCGQRAAPGAIERVRIDPETLEPRLRVIGCDSWSDEPGFAEAEVTGVCGSGIIEAIAELHLAGVIATDGTIDGSLAARSPRIVADGRTFGYLLHAGTPELAITQNDVRQIQLAKAALHAGCTLLLERYGIDSVGRIRLAGAFGSHIDPVHALVLGLVPDCEPAGVSSAGNAAGTGARIALLNRAARGEIERIVRRIEKLETAVEPRFQEHFVGAMAVPHETDPYQRLQTSVRLPERRSVARPERGRRRRERSAS
ncbi:MAG: ASKHA domain-containing protein [Gaiellales bacterium]